MKTRVLIGIAGVLSSLLIGCTNIELDRIGENAPYGFHYKEFGMGETKTTTVS